MSTYLQRSVCPYDCPDACGLLVSVENNQVIKVAGDPEHPFTRGMLCPKMAHYEKTVHSPRRLTQPLLRTGPKGEGLFRPVAWHEAISRIISTWQQIISSHGAEAILPYSYAGTMGLIQRNAGHAFFHKLGASRLLRTICAPAQDYGWKAVMGDTASPRPDEVIHSDLIILWSINAVATNLHFVQAVQAAKKRGAKVLLIDTYETPTARIADRVFLPRPGSDGALALGIMHLIYQENLFDKYFVENYVQGFDQFAFNILPKYTPAVVSSLTGLPEEEIREIAHLYANASAPFIRLGAGLSRYGNGAMAVRSICCLPALVGAWSKPGGGLLTSISTGSAFNMTEITGENLPSPPARSINMNQLGHALTKLTDPPVKSLYVYNANPASVAPDQNAVLTGLTRSDLFTVVHDRFMTDTARYADVVLPATTSLEHDDMYRSYGHYCLQRAFAAIPPVGESKSNWNVFTLLAKEMGFDDQLFSKTTDALISDLLTNPSPWLRKADPEKLKTGMPVELPLPAGYKTEFRTRSGKIEILNPAESEPLPCYLEPYGDKAPYWLVSAPSLTLLNSSFNERDDLFDGKQMTLKMNPDDAAAKNLPDGSLVAAFNERGEVAFTLEISEKVPRGVVVTEGIWWLSRAPGSRTVNALTSQRLTDSAEGSTFYDTKVDVKAL